jgi:hypothetical protein
MFKVRFLTIRTVQELHLVDRLDNTRFVSSRRSVGTRTVPGALKAKRALDMVRGPAL